MNAELEILEKIELYTKGKLSSEDMLAFEKEIASDPRLKRRVEASLIVEEMVIGHEAMKLKEQMRKDLFPPKFPWRLYVPIALLVISITGIAYLWLTKDKASSEKKVTQIISTQVIAAQKGGHGEVNQPVDSLPKQPNPKRSNNQVTPATKENVSASIPFSETKEPIVLDEKTAMTSPTIVHAPTIEAAMIKTKHVEKTTNPCASLHTKIEFYTVPSCAGGETGEVHIKPESVVGGSPPFSFKIGEKSSVASFYHLSPGTYQLQIKDSKGCTVESAREAVVSSKVCKEKKEYTFNPEFDLSWAIPYDQQKEPKLFKVMDKGGKPFFETTVLGLHPTEWKGESNTGLSLGLGLYFFTIEYQDGTTEEGTIVITR